MANEKRVSQWTVMGMLAQVVSRDGNISASLSKNGELIRGRDNFATWDAAVGAVDTWVEEIRKAKQKKGGK